MEQTNVQAVGKKVWNLVRLMYAMLRKGISKGKLIVTLNTMLKRGKIAGKSAILNLMLHHHSAASDRHSHDGQLSFSSAPRDEYEFSCSNSPTLSFPFHLGKWNKHRSRACDDHAPEVKDDVATALAVRKVLEMPGFGAVTPVRQLRITDSPSPFREVGGVDGHVDAAAEDFIVRFYSGLRKQNEKGLC